ncbi:hypothetical protein Tco_0484517 [Tanacetum coccineum]
MENMTWKIQAKKSFDSRELFFLTFWSGQRARIIWSSFVGRSRNWDVRSNTLSPEGAMSQYRDRGNNNLNNANIVVGKSCTWMTFGGNTRDLGSLGEETDKTTTLHQILEEVVHTECGDGVASFKRRRQDV